MSVWVKLMASAAVLCFAVGYAARHRDRALHMRMMSWGILLAMAAPLGLLAGLALGLESPGIAYWVAVLMGGRAAAQWTAWVHQAAAAAVLALLWGQALLGLRRSPWHALVARVALPAGALVYLGTLFIYYG